MDQIAQLQTQIDELKKEIQSLKSSNTIPLDIERAFSNRGFILPGLKGDGFVLPVLNSTAPIPVEYWEVKNTNPTRFLALYEANV